MKVLLRVCLAMAVSSLALPVLAQSPNTAAIVVVVLDQTGAIVAGANVTTTNTATGAIREVISGADGSATISGLSLTGTYAIRVNKSGFSAEEIADLALRAGETATVKVTLVVSGGKTEVVVYGTGQGVRADSQIGRSLESTTIDATPILGRKVTTVPLFNSAFRQGKGTGDLFVNATYFITGAGSRRTTTFMLDGASNDEAWGRQTMLATVPIGAVQEMSVLSNAFSAEFGWTAGPAMNIVTKTGTNTLHGEMLFLGRPGGAQARTFATDGFCAPSVPSCVTRARWTRSIRQTFRMNWARPRARSAAPSSRTRHSFSSRQITRVRTERRFCHQRCRRSCCRQTAASPTWVITARSSSTRGSITSYQRRRR